MSQYKPVFRWIPGETNDTADGLSRRHDFISAVGPASKVDLKQLLKSIVDGDDDKSENDFTMFSDYDQARLVYYAMTTRDIRTLCIAGYSKDRQFARIWKHFFDGGRMLPALKTFWICPRAAHLMRFG